MIGLKSVLYKIRGDFVKQDIEQYENDNPTFDDILHYIKDNVDYNAASLLLFGESRKKLKTVAKYGEGCNLIRGMNFKMGSGLSAWLAQKKRTICLSDIHRGARHGHNPIRSVIAVPILYHDDVIGFLNLAHVIPNAYGPNEEKKLLNLTQSLASQINELITTEKRKYTSEGYNSSC